MCAAVDEPAAGEHDAAGSTRPVAALRPRFQLSLQPPRAPVAPHGLAEVRLRINNDADGPTRYRLRLDGLPAAWVDFDPLTKEVAPGADCTIDLLLRPGLDPAYPPGRVTLRLNVAPEDAPQLAREQTITVELLPGRGFGMAQDGDDLVLHNHGNVPLRLQLAIRAPAPATAPTLPPGPLTLAAGEQRRIPLRVARRPLALRRRARGFTIEARSLDTAGFTIALPAGSSAATRPGRRVLLLTLALAAAILAALFATRPVTPTILAFQTGRTLLPRGEPLVLSWQVRDAAALELSLNGEPLNLQLDARQTGYRLDTRALADEITLQLEARNGGQRAVRSLVVIIHEPLRVASFRASPERLLRHVVQELALRWEVPGAQQVRIEGLAPASNREVGAGSAVDGLEDLPVLVDDALTLTLVAVDNYGNVLRQALTIPADPATCRVSSEPLTLHDDPQADAAEVTQLATGRSVAISGRDPSGAWLRTEVEGVSVWGRREGLRCAGFAPADLRILRPGRG